MTRNVAHLEGLVPDRLAPKTRKIVLEDYELRLDIGFHDFEIGRPQRLLVTVEVWLDERSFPDEDDQARAWDYDFLRTEIAALAARFPDAALSVDTSKAAVAAAALDAGAAWVNDVWALKADPGMAPLVAARCAPVVLMHNRSRPKAVASNPRLGSEYVGARYGHLMDEVAADLAALAADAVAAGIDRARIILDPGIGFGKTAVQNMALLNHLDRLKPLGFPLLIGPSRKSFIGRVLDVGPDERDEGTAACIAVGIARGADIVRVHDVRSAVRVAKMTDAIIRASADGAGGDGRSGA